MQSAWAELQSEFAAAVVDARLPPPADVVECGGADRRRGFAVYRNNAIVSLIDALRERFPVTCRLVGEEFFRAIARAYASRQRPRSPLLITYGDDFPSFIERFTPAESVPYLPDVARLERAWSEAYHAPDATPLETRALAGASPDAMLAARLVLHPSTRFLRSDYPVADLWSTHLAGDTVRSPTNWDPQDVLIVRPAADVVVSRLAPGHYAFISAVADRRCLRDAADLALRDRPEFDPGRAVMSLLQLGAIVAFDGAGTQEGSS